MGIIGVRRSKTIAQSDPAASLGTKVPNIGVNNFGKLLKRGEDSDSVELFSVFRRIA